jgi:hypothetical protein
MKNNNNNEMPIAISIGFDDLKMKKNGRRQNTAHA